MTNAEELSVEAMVELAQYYRSQEAEFRQLAQKYEAKVRNIKQNEALKRAHAELVVSRSSKEASKK